MPPVNPRPDAAELGWPAPTGWPTDARRDRGRLCIVLLPQDKAKEARARVQKELGDKTTPEALWAADYVVVFTTVTRERLGKEQVMELYRVRWQIELYIKRDKSIAGLDQLPNFREDTIFTWLCTKLLLTQIAHRIANPDVVSANIRNPKLLRLPHTWIPQAPHLPLVQQLASASSN